MIWTYKQRKKASCTFQSDYLDGKDALQIAEDLEKTGRGYDFEFTDEMGTVWSKKELTKLLTKVKGEPHDITVFFDGGYLKEEGRAGLGSIIYFTQNDCLFRRRSNLEIGEIESSNEAEYAAFYECLKILDEIGVHHQTCTFKGDSQVVLNQLSGEWPCFDNVLNQWADRIEEKMRVLGILPKYELISRKENKEADTLATKALQGIKIDSELEIGKKEDS